MEKYWLFSTYTHVLQCNLLDLPAFVYIYCIYLYFGDAIEALYPREIDSFTLHLKYGDVSLCWVRPLAEVKKIFE